MAAPPKTRSLPPISPLFEFQHRFRRLTIRGFRRLLDVSLPLAPLSVLIGANGSGKTSVLDVLTLLARSAQGEMTSALSDFSGLANILTAGHAQELNLGMAMDVPDPRFPSVTPSGRVEYALTLKPQGINYAIEQEVLSQQRQAQSPPLL